MFHVAVFALYVLLLMACRQTWPDGILFYQGLSLAVAMGVGHGMYVAFHRGRRADSTPFKDATLTFLLAYAFMFTVPTTVDRSYSVRMLQLLATNPQGLTREALNRHFAGYFVRQGGVDRRITEQQATGSVALQGDEVTLTERGRWLARLFDLSCSAFSCHRN